MKVIFLDIDGVLNNSWEHIHKLINPDLVKIINSVIEKTGAGVVISSTWRFNVEYKNILAKEGFKIEAIIGETPRLREIFMLQRGKEIRKWLKEHPEVTEYAIIDDDTDIYPKQREHFFQTNFKVGITADIANDVIQYLNEERPEQKINSGEQ